MRSRDVAAASALRSALAAIDHAVAIPLGHSGTTATASRLRREAQVLSDFIEGWLAVLCGRAEAELPAASWRILQQPPPPQPILRDLGEPYERQLALLVIGQPEM